MAIDYLRLFLAAHVATGVVAWVSHAALSSAAVALSVLLCVIVWVAFATTRSTNRTMIAVGLGIAVVVSGSVLDTTRLPEWLVSGPWGTIALALASVVLVLLSADREIRHEQERTVEPAKA